MNHIQVIDFWFKELAPKDWFKKNPQLDQKIVEKFSSTLKAAVVGELSAWRESALGALAEILVLDQFPRNMFRDDARSFATDPIALVLAQEAVRRNLDKELTTVQCGFLYMPYMHSESKLIHEIAIQLFSRPGLENNLEYAHRHKVIIDRFGRYPHRNLALGRTSTAEELEFIKSNSGF